jgi:ribonuclease-3
VLRVLTGFFTVPFSQNKAVYKKLKHILGFYPLQMHCYMQALRHHSVSTAIHENGSRDSNERLEYLGDSVLNTVIAELLFSRYPYKNEGFLTEMRSKIVSRESLNDLSVKIGLNQLVEYDRKAMGINTKNTIFGNALEALIGAVFLDAGFESAKHFILSRLLLHIDMDKLQVTETNYKGRLIEWGQKNNKTILFDCDEEISGRQKIYKISLRIEDEMVAHFEHLSKKKAEQLAAQKACEKLSLTF